MKKIMKVLMAFVVGFSLFATPIKAEEMVSNEVENENVLSNVILNIKNLNLESEKGLTLPYKMPIELNLETNVSTEFINMEALFMTDANELIYIPYYQDTKNLVFAEQLKYKQRSLEFIGMSITYFEEGKIKEPISKLFSPYTKDEILAKYQNLNNTLDYYELETNTNIKEYTYTIDNFVKDEKVSEISDIKLQKDGLKCIFDIYFKEADISGISSAELSFLSEDGAMIQFKSGYEFNRISDTHYQLVRTIEETQNTYGEYKFNGISIMDNAGNFLSIYSDYSEWNPSWDTIQFAYTAEENIYESLTAEDIMVSVAEKQNFKPSPNLEAKKRNPQLFVYIDNLKIPLEIQNMNEVEETVFGDIPNSGTGSITKKITYEIKTTANQTKKFTLDTDIFYYGESQGKVLVNEEYWSYAMKFEEAKQYDMFKNGKPYNVRLNDGSIITEYGETGFVQGGAGGETDEDGNLKEVRGRTAALVSLKYTFDKWTPDTENYNSPVSYRVFFVDEAGNLVDDKGNVLVPYAQRKDVQYKTLNDDVNVSSLEGSLPTKTTVDAKEVELDDVFGKQAYQAYDITLTANYEKVQPVEAVTVSMNLSDELKGKEVEVYYVDDKGNKELVKDSVVKDDKVSFETNHFSTYSVVEKEVSTNTDNEETVKPIEPEKDDNETKPNQIPNENKPNEDRQNENTPNTGDTTMLGAYVFLGLASVLLLVVMKKKANLRG